MFADSHQTRTLEVPHRARFVRFGWIAIWLIVGVVVVSLLVGFTWSHNLVPYPNAERLAAAQLQLRFQPQVNISQQSGYQTSDDLPQVLGWYAQHFGLSHEMPQGDTCVTMTRVDPYLFFQQSLSVTLCAHPTQTLIFVNRNLAIR